jgi:hypothetical protein
MSKEQVGQVQLQRSMEGDEDHDAYLEGKQGWTFREDPNAS